MPDNTQSANIPGVAEIVERCMPRLRALSLSLDTYGRSDDAQELSEIIGELQTTVPVRPPSPDQMEFNVAGTFRVRRFEVARLLACCFRAGVNMRYEVVEFTEPRVFRFRADAKRVTRRLDYPLNEGGALAIARKEAASKVCRLDLSSISDGLNVMAAHYPRHFADFLNESADEITADVLLQCCLFGKLLYD